MSTADNDICTEFEICQRCRDHNMSCIKFMIIVISAYSISKVKNGFLPELFPNHLLLFKEVLSISHYNSSFSLIVDHTHIYYSRKKAKSARIVTIYANINPVDQLTPLAIPWFWRAKSAPLDGLNIWGVSLVRSVSYIALKKWKKNL